MSNEQGYVIVALQHDTHDYVACARKLAQSLHHWHPQAMVCLITDQDLEPDQDFAFVEKITRSDPTNAWADDWQIFYRTPFKENIKLEADMLIASPIDHWWTLFRLKDVVISTGCRNWRDQVSPDRSYRKAFDQNHLPDVYNAVTYWRLSTTAKEFFDLVRDIFQQWNNYRRCIKFAEEIPSTDLVYAIAAQMLGPERVTLPFVDYPKIVHMKRQHAGTKTHDWTRELVWEYHHGQLRVQTQAQWGAFHYHIKHWQP